MRLFDVNNAKDGTIAWIRDFFDEFGQGCNAIIGLSGGKESAVAAALCAEALGKDRVIGVMTPNLSHAEAELSTMLCERLGIRSFMLPVTLAVADMFNAMQHEDISPSAESMKGLTARMRVAALYAVAQSMDGLVVDTSNLSGRWAGYSAPRGSVSGDFRPLEMLTSDEVASVGYACGLTKQLAEWAADDGLSSTSERG